MNNYFENKVVLITGINGFVGSNLANELVKQNALVIGITRSYDVNPNLKIDNSGKITIIHGDITNNKMIKYIFDKYLVNIVFHLAGQPIVSHANENPLETFNSNIIGTLNILEASRDCKNLSALILASSSKLYDEKEIPPYTEETPLFARLPYDSSKMCMELIAKFYFESYKVPIGISRFNNIYGEGDINFTRIIPNTIKSVIENKVPIIKSDGSPIKEYNYIGDIVNSYLTFAKILSNGEFHGEVFNFGSGERISVINLVNKIIKLSDKKINPEVKGNPYRTEKISEQYLSSEKAKKLLGWNPEIELDVGLKKTIDWYKENLGSILGRGKKK